MGSLRGALAVVVVAPAASVALAASGYSVGVSASSPVVSGHSFSAKAHGVVPQKALLYVDLSRKACQATSTKESRVVGVYKSGESYFWQKHGRRKVKEAWQYAWVSGSFKKSFTAHAGTVAGREYACAYLDRANKYGGYRVTTARASTHYTVTK